MASSGITVKPLAAPAWITALFRPPPDKIKQVKDASWFGPWQPVKPIAPEGTEPRGAVFAPGQNLSYTPRFDAPLTALQLQALATYPLARICIEDAKDQICQMSHTIQRKHQRGQSQSEWRAASKNDRKIAELNDFFDCPDGENAWADWLRPYLEDMFVIDAGSILLRATASGKLAQLRVIPGETITRYVDENGYTPAPPSPAYAQLWFGIPLVNLTTDQLIYRPRNIVHRGTYASYLYGMSPTEQQATEIQIGIQRLASVLAYYTFGDIAGALHIIPPGVPPDKVEESFRNQIATMAGDLAKKNQIVPYQGYVDRTQSGGASGDQIVFTKDKLLADAFDDMHIRKIAYGYGVSPQRLLKMIRTEGQASTEATMEEGIMPYVGWVKNTIDFIIQRKFGLADYEISFDPTRDVDAVKQADADSKDVAAGVVARNEIRDKRGLDPDPSPMASELTVTAGNQVIPLSKVGEEPADGGDGDGGGVPASNGRSGKGGSEGTNPKGPRAGKLAKRDIRIDPAVLGVHSAQGKTRLAGALKKCFAKQREEAVRKAQSLLKRARKSSPMSKADRDSEEIAAAIYAAIEEEWRFIPAEAREALEQSILNGVADGIVQVNFADNELISSVNESAAEWARSRAASLVGMKYDEAGALVENPSAKWAISDTTREELRDLITSAFEKQTPMTELIKEIRDAGMFSDSRAEMIARTEVGHAQAQGNYEVWKRAGVKRARWLVDGDPCPICLLNDGEERDLGSPFTSGAIGPWQTHPNCECVLVAVV